MFSKMKITKRQRNNIIFGVIILLMIIPQTRQPIQILIHKGLALFSPSVVDEDERIQLANYNWNLVDEDGVPFDFNDAKGKVIFVNFWATWCPPCIAEMPSVENLYKDYNEDVLFLLVSNEDRETVAKFKSKRNYDFKVYSSISAEPNELETTSIPRSFIIDKYGTIVLDKSGAANWNSVMVRELLHTLLKAE